MFVEFFRLDNGQPITVNVADITWFEPCGDEATRLRTVHGTLDVKHSYKDVQAAINRGCDELE